LGKSSRVIREIPKYQDFSNFQENFIIRKKAFKEEKPRTGKISTGGIL